MANWVRDFLEKNPELSNRVVKRARHALHTRNDDGTVTARFTGAPMHYQDERGEWQAIDTAIRKLPNGKLGAPGISIELDDDGQVNLEGYSQVTRRVGIYNANTGEFVQVFDLPTPKIDDDKLVQETGIYKHVITLKEAGLREELIIKEKPAQLVDTKIADNTNLWLVMDTTVTGQEFEDGWVDDDAKFEKGEFRFVPPKAQDANDNELSVKRHARKTEGKQHLLTGIQIDALNDAVYPVTIDPDFTGDTADGFIWGQNASYNTARSTSSGGSQTALFVSVGQEIPSTVYYIYRGFVLFDTSSIPDGASITQVNLKLTAYYDFSSTDFDVQIVKTDWSSNTDFSNVTQRENAYDACLADDADDNIWRNTSGMGTNTTYTSGNLSTAWVSKTGTTYYGLRSSRDKSATTPSSNEYIRVHSQDATTESYRPVLVVTYTTVTAYTLTCAAGSYSLTGTACTLIVQRNYVLSCASATYTLTGSDAGFEIHYTLAIDAGSYALAGADATLEVKRNYTLSAGAGSYTQTGAELSFALQRNYILSADAGSYTLAGTEAGLHRGYTLSCGVESYALAGIAVGLHRGYTLSAGVENYTLSGTETTLTSERTLSAEASSYALTGTDAGLYRGYTLSTSAGNYTQTGTDLSFVLQRNYTLLSEAGSYEITGSDISFILQRNYTLSFDGGSYEITGSGLSFVLQKNYILSLDAGLYETIGSDILFEIRRDYALLLEAGSHSLTGTNANYIVSLSITAGAGVYTLTGTSISIDNDYAMSALAGSYILDGSDITLIPQSNYSIELNSGSYSTVGTETNFIIQYNHVIQLDNGMYALSGSNISLSVASAYVILLEAGIYSLDGSDISLLFQKNYTLQLENGSYTLVGSSLGLLLAQYLLLADAGIFNLVGTDAVFVHTVLQNNPHYYYEQI